MYARIIDMAKKSQDSFKASAQSYPRIEDLDSKYNGCLDDAKLVQHDMKIPLEKVKAFIKTAIEDANRKSSRAIMSIKSDDDAAKVTKRYIKEGRKLLEYFVKYCVDPAATAHDIQGKHYSAVASDLFRRPLCKRRE